METNSIKYIITQRKIHKESWYDIVYEWEDELKDYFKCNFFCDKILYSSFWDKAIRRSSFLSKLFYCLGEAKSFAFVMAENLPVFNHPNVIPLIIDSYCDSEKKVRVLERKYSNCKVILISSAEAYAFIHKKSKKLNAIHVGLSLPDKYRIDENSEFNKDIDLLLVGRQNPVLMNFLGKYIKKHPNFVYVQCKKINGVFVAIDSKGGIIGPAETHDEMKKIMERAKCALYATSNMDGDKKQQSSFHQVTPRFLELLSSGCNLLLRYENNSDTVFYQLNNFCPSINDYISFENRLDYCLKVPADMKIYSEYLKKHYTSVRAKEIDEILKREINKTNE